MLPSLRLSQIFPCLQAVLPILGIPLFHEYPVLPGFQCLLLVHPYPEAPLGRGYRSCPGVLGLHALQACAVRGFL